MKKFKWNRFYTILVLLMFLTVTYASFNTHLFINGKAYLRVDEAIRIIDIKLLETENEGYETFEPEYDKNTIAMDANLPKQNSSVTYQVSIKNSYPYDYDITDILEDSYSNTDVKYEIIGVEKNTILPANTTTTFTIKFTNNVTVVEEHDVYETKEYTFDYTGKEQEFIVPYDGEYTLETWGAQGGCLEEGSLGGYGGYSKGTITLRQNQKLYINVGGTTTTGTGGYNGGGSVIGNVYGGGGATHMALTSGTLNKLGSQQNYVIIVAGAGGGSGGVDQKYEGGHAGGISGMNGHGDDAGIGGTQSKPGGAGMNGKGAGAFGLGGTGQWGRNESLGGGGAGYYGGGSGGGRLNNGSGGGGSGYIGDSRLKNKIMYCYNCTESSAENTKTVSTTNVSEIPISNYAKEGNGYAKITVTRKIEDGSIYGYDYTGGEQTFTAPYTGVYQLETWGAQGTSYDETTIGGYGGYSVGKIKLQKNDVLYINVGGQSTTLSGGYNGGGSVKNNEKYWYGKPGGGATHIANVSGLLSTLQNKLNNIFIVSGAGGGASARKDKNLFFSGGSGGGYKGCDTDIPTGGTQTAPGVSAQYGTGSFGLGASSANEGAGGSGFYGGGSGRHDSIGYSGAGGSGYIGNSQLTDKVMYCYNCEESKEESTKTVATLAHSELPKQNQAKEGNGYSRITLLKRIVNNTKLTLKLEFARHLYNYDISYDLNYQIKNDMNTYWDIYSGNRCCSGGTGTTGSFTKKFEIRDGKRYYVMEKTADSDEKNTGIYLKARKGQPLTVGTSYTYTFEAKANKQFNVSTGSEQQGSLVIFTIPTEWKKITHTFEAKQTSTNASRSAFDFYYWANVGENRKLEVRDLTIQETEYNFTPTTYSLRETDKIGKNIPANPVRDGYQFLGWYDDPIAGEKVTSETIVPSQNTTYYAHYSPIIYNIDYDLAGGEATTPTTTYSHDSDAITLPTPTKDGYTFTGWTGGKNLFNKDDYHILNAYFEENSTEIIENNWNRTFYLEIKPNTTYTVSKVKSAQLQLAYTTELPEIGTAIYGSTGSYAIRYDNDERYYMTITTGENAKYLVCSFVQTAQDSLSVQEIANTVQVEEGTIPTKYEEYGATPQTSLKIPMYSSGNRSYTANWIKNYQIDVNHFEDGEWIDKIGASDPRYTNLKFDVYINGQLKASQVNDYNQRFDEGTTYEITNFTYDTNAFDLIVGGSVNTGATNFSFNNPTSGTLSQNLVNMGTSNIKINIELRAKS